MAKEEKAPIIIVKRKKKGGGGHHGGAWKVAYADFVTAMMAFFLVMWLVSSISKEQRAAVFDYFKNPSMEPGKSSRPAPGQMGPGGASTSVINMGGGMDAPRVTVMETPQSNPKSKPQPFDMNNLDVEQARKIADEADHKKLESLLEELRKAIDKSQALRPFKDQLLLDITPEGLRIQIVDAQNRPMFDVGSAKLKDYTTTILKILAGYLNTVPNRISLTGHTDMRPYPGGVNYTNWELSADRANAARRALESGGLVEQKIARVVGLSSSVLFDKDNPQNPINRRISIIVMTKQAEDSALKSEARPENVSGGVSVTEPAPATPVAPPTQAAPPPSAAPPLRTAAPAPAAGTTAVATRIVDTAKPEVVPLTPATLPHGLPAPVAAADGAP
ncbi:MAG TPA: flagellar motor protein MotB [Steroidobacteraceae bacterium]|jgi:chemotaxis protein MotB|nr:flagellar motor protein MotB [Steroidobacteraceae bacterium]